MWRNALFEWAGLAAIGTAVFLLAFSVWCWAQGPVDYVDASQNSAIAVLQERVSEVYRRVGCIEDRLFVIFLTAGGAALGSIVSSVFSIKAHRSIRRNGGGK